MSYKISITKRFKRDYKRCMKRGLDKNLLYDVVEQLRSEGCLSAFYRPHRLTGGRAGQWECHIRPDWLLVWRQDDDILTLMLLETGTHADLFG